MPNLANSDPSRPAKWVLLASSLVTLVFLIAAAVRENITSEWRHYQQRYQKLLAERATDERGRKLARDFSVELRQISVPELAVVDRCVTCHTGIEDPRMSGAPLPFRAHSGKILETHPVDKFGCTTCHGGQGAAVDFANAKGEDAFWDYPLLPARLTEASCASCHDPAALPAGAAPLLVKGRQLYEAKSCGSCHKLEGKGGVLGPPLDNVGMKTRHQFVLAHLKGRHIVPNWLSEHFRDPAAVVPGSVMKNPAATEPEILALTAFMLSLRQRDFPQKYMGPDKIEQAYHRLHPGPPDGARLYQQYCFACHDSGSFGRWDKTFRRFIPAIRGPGLLRVASDDYLKQNISGGRPGTVMPAWDAHSGGLSAEELTALVRYLRKDGLPGPPAPAPPAVAAAAASAGSARVSGDPVHGAELWLQNCASCHGAGGKGGVAPNLANATFQKAADDAFLLATISGGRPNTAMPSFQRAGARGLTGAEIADVVAFIRALAGPNPHQQRESAALADGSRRAQLGPGAADGGPQLVARPVAGRPVPQENRRRSP